MKRVEEAVAVVVSVTLVVAAVPIWIGGFPAQMVVSGLAYGRDWALGRTMQDVS